MKPQINKRRRFIKTSLAIPLLTNLPWTIPIANALPGGRFMLPPAIYDELVRMYGDEVNHIVSTDRIQFKTPKIAENGAVVTVRVTGEKDLVSSMAIFVEKNTKPLASTCTLFEGSDLDVALRIKVPTTSDVYLIAQTNDGLVGISNQVKVTIGCGGG